MAINQCTNKDCRYSHLDWGPFSKEETRKQVQCPICGLWAVWKAPGLDSHQQLAREPLCIPDTHGSSYQV